MKRITDERYRRRWLVLFALVCILAVPALFIPAEAAADESTVVIFTIGSSAYTVNGSSQVMDVSPTIIEGRTLLPIRFAAEPLGAKVGWDGTTQKATVSMDGTLIELWIGQSKALVNGGTVPIDAGNLNVKPLIISGRTMLPLRFVTENLGCDVQWDPITKEVIITSDNSSAGIAKVPEADEDTGKIPDVKLPDLATDLIKDSDKIPDIEKKPDTQIPDVSKLPEFKVPVKDQVFNVNDLAYYENYYGTVLTLDTEMLTTADDTYKWGVTNTKDMSLQYFTFFLKPNGEYEKFRASFFLDSSAKADLVMNIRKETKDGMVLKSLTLKPGKTLKDVTVNISGVNRLCIESEMRINHGTVKKIVVGEPVFINSK